MKRLLAAACLVAVGVLVGVLSASGASNTSASSAAQAARKSVTFHVVEKSVGFNFIDNPPRQGFNSPPLIGDQFAFTSNLLTKGGAHAGTLEATCTVTRGGDHTRGPLLRSVRAEGRTDRRDREPLPWQSDPHRGGRWNRRLRGRLGQHPLGLPRREQPVHGRHRPPDLALARPLAGAQHTPLRPHRLKRRTHRRHCADVLRLAGELGVVDGEVTDERTRPRPRAYLPVGTPSGIPPGGRF